VAVHDLTAKLAAAALEEKSEDQEFIQRALLAAIVESSEDAIVSKALDGRILSWNAGAERLFGYKPEEVIGRSITVIIPPELHEEERGILERLRRGERIEHFETTRVRKDGRRLPISLTVSPVRNRRGEIVAASKIARDISERAVTDQLLRERETLLSAEAEVLGKLNDWTSRLWRCRDLAQGLDEMLGVVIELLGADKGNVQLLDEEHAVLKIVAQRGFAADFLDFFREVSTGDDSACGRALRSGERVVIEDIETDAGYTPMRAVARAANYRSVLSTPLISVDGASLGMLSAHFAGVHRPTEADLRRLDLFVRQASDFIQRCRMEEALRKSEQALRDADRRKDEFLALLAHELRNPLAPVRYAIATIKKPGRTAEQQKRAEAVIERQVDHMSRLLDDLLDVSRITRGSLQLKKTRTELTLIIGTAIDAARPLLEAKGHQLSLELPKEPVAIEADPVRLAQVFSNLLINAGKYTDPGGHISLRATQQDTNVIVAVRDDGIGIASEAIPRLFTLFYQAQSATGRSEGGLGVGLALVRGLVALHGGVVEARSAGVNKGSEFLVRLPAGTSVGRRTPPEHSVAVAESRDPLKVLVVDDNRDAAESCAALLSLNDHDVRMAFDGRTAVEIASTFHPDVLLLDIGLPDMSGYQVAAKIRSMPWAGAAILIAVSGWGRDEDKRRAVAAGFDQHLTKPISGEALESVLNSVAH
jgi:PAS domain S-box-containing protein